MERLRIVDIMWRTQWITLFTVIMYSRPTQETALEPSQCVSGTYLKLTDPQSGSLDHQCVVDCGPGFYGDSNVRSCQPCDANTCLTCSYTSSNCTSCLAPYFLLGNRCVGDCGVKLSRGAARSRLRLRGGRNDFEGRIEILHEGVWGTICDDAWDINDAQVVCNELQIGDAVQALSVSDRTFDLASERTPIHLDNMKCLGTESKVEFCPRLFWGRHNCAHYEDAAVVCSGPDLSRLCVTSCGDGYYRVPGTNHCELCSPECLTCYGRADRCLSCGAPRFLLDENCPENCGQGLHGNTATHTCQPCHENCRECFDGVTNDICSSCADHLYMEGQKCIDDCGTRLSRNLAIRLAGGVIAYEGRVEVYINGQWGTVCDDNWDVNDAEVVCRELGYGPALAAITGPAFSPGVHVGPVLLGNVQCQGTEVELIHCQQNQWGSSQCRHTEDAGVRCEGRQSLVTAWGTLVSTPIHPGDTGRCVDNCGTGYYLPAESNYNCATCSSNCLSCDVVADRCTSCKPSKFLKDSSCVTTCSPEEYGNEASQRCELCDTTQCDTCRDSTQNNICKSCDQGKVLKDSACIDGCGTDMFNQGGICQSECDQGFYGNTASYICQTCSEECLSCGFNQEFSIVCTACRIPQLLYNGQCLDVCPPTTFVSIMDSEDVPNRNQIRLVGGRDQLEGRLEVFHDEQWGTVCGDHRTISLARVACRQLNLGSILSVLRLSSFNQIMPGQGPVWLDMVNCRGNEEKLEDCQRNSWGANSCSHLNDVAIRCSGPGVRQCVSSCPVSFFADTQSRQCSPCLKNCLSCVNEPSYRCLSCSPGSHLLEDRSCVEDCGSGYYLAGNSSTCLKCDNSCATCSEEASSCMSCNSPLILEGHTCVPECDGYVLIFTEEIRLVGGASPLEGRVEVLYQGEYGTVCDDKWDLHDADVVCRQLGYGTAVSATEEASHGQGTGAIVLDNVICEGDEKSLMLCDHAGLGVNNCEHGEDAGVVCFGPLTSNICIPRENCSRGFYVAANGKTCGKCSYNCETCAGKATICVTCPAGQFLTKEKVCVETCPEGYYGDDAGICQNCSSDCLDCATSATHCTSCAPSLYLEAGTCVASCSANTFIRRGPTDIRLVGGDIPSAGRLEIMYNGSWGTVCDDSFDMNDASVACRQLQMGDAVAFYTDAHFGPGTGEVALDELSCNGEEDSLANCPAIRRGAGHLDCLHDEDAGVLCSLPGSAMHCLADCGNRYYANSNMECEHCSSPCHSCDSKPTRCTSCAPPLFLSIEACVARCPTGQYGNENSRGCEPCAARCQGCYDGVADNVCKSCSEGFYLSGSSCLNQCHRGSVLESILPHPAVGSIPTVRLAGGGELNEDGRAVDGRVEVLQDDQWGLVCADDWDLIDGEIVCQQLGLGHVSDLRPDSAYGSLPIGMPVVMNGVDCQGWEYALSQCRHARQGEARCRSSIVGGRGAAAVRCDGSSATRPPKNICRDVAANTCRPDSCDPGVTCVDLEGRGSVCLECPMGQVGNGRECIMVANTLPRFQQTPEDRILNIGNPAVLNCGAVPGTAPEVSVDNWLKNGEPLPSTDLLNGRIKAWNFGSLYFTTTRRGDTAVYTCFIQNTYGVATANATVTVEEPPQIMQKRDIVVAVGDDAMMDCVVISEPPADITWRFGGQPIADDRFTSSSANGTLAIRGVSSDDEGGYQCFAENKKGTANAMVILTVHEPPKFTVEPIDVEAEVGHEVILRCQAQGKPTPRIQWKKNGDELPHIENKFTLTASGDLKLAKVEISDMGSYNCIAVNSVQASSLSARLLVNGPPVFQTTPSNQNFSTGETVTLLCSVMGTHNPTISWEKDGQPIEDSDHYNLQEDGLQIKSISQADSGDYVCIGSNREGVVESRAHITVYPPVYGKQQTVGLVWILVVLIITLLLIITVATLIILRRRSKQQKQFSHSRMSPKKSGGGGAPGVVVYSGNGNYVEIKKQRAKEEKEAATMGIMDDVDMDVV